MHSLAEHHAGRAVKLRHDNPLRAIDDEGASLGHVRNPAEIDLLLDSLFPVRFIGFVLVGEFELDLQRDIIGQATLDALLDGVFWLVEAVGNIFQEVEAPGIGNGKSAPEHFLKALVLAFFKRNAVLDEIMERIELYLEKIGGVYDTLDL